MFNLLKLCFGGNAVVIVALEFNRRLFEPPVLVIFPKGKSDLASDPILKTNHVVSSIKPRSKISIMTCMK